MFLVLQEKYLHILLHNDTFLSAAVPRPLYTVCAFKMGKIAQGGICAALMCKIEIFSGILSTDFISWFITVDCTFITEKDVWICSYDHILYFSSEANCLVSEITISQLFKWLFFYLAFEVEEIEMEKRCSATACMIQLIVFYSPQRNTKSWMWRTARH